VDIMLENRRTIQYKRKNQKINDGKPYSTMHILGNGERNTDVLLITQNDKVLSPRGYRSAASLVGGIIGVLSYLAFFR